jgi:AraC family transcriptional regulator
VNEDPKPGPASSRNYIERINRVIDYIDAHLAENLSLDLMARVAAFSKFHFHRIFFGLMGETLGDYISRQRLQKAAYLLLSLPRKSITEIALDCGFSGSAVFSKKFKEHFGTTASLWRDERSAQGRQRISGDIPDAAGKGAALGHLENSAVSVKTVSVKYLGEAQLWSVASGGVLRTIEVKRLPDMRLAYIRYFGPYKGDAELFAASSGGSFPGSWRAALFRLNPQSRRSYTMSTPISRPTPNCASASAVPTPGRCGRGGSRHDGFFPGYLRGFPLFLCL